MVNLPAKPSVASGRSAQKMVLGGQRSGNLHWRFPTGSVSRYLKFHHFCFHGRIGKRDRLGFRFSECADKKRIPAICSPVGIL